MDLVIRDVELADEKPWRRLWREYLVFYETTLPAPVTDATWRRITDPNSPMFARVALLGSEMVGFAVCVVHEGSWKLGSHCYLEDLFVDIDRRRSGVGRMLIEDLVSRGQHLGWASIYWRTREDNTIARTLYDKLARPDGFIGYRIPLEGT